MQVLNRYDKEQPVIKLHQEGKNMQNITSAPHMSFSDNGAIIRRIDGRANADMNNKSKTTQAIYLFKSGKKPIEVVI